MASIQKHGKRWRVQIQRDGRRLSKVFDTKARAAAWAMQNEAELTGAKLPDKTLADAMDKFAKEIAPGRKGGRWEVIRLKALAKHQIAKRKLSGLARDDFAAWRDTRLEKVGKATVAREMTLLRAVIKQCMGDWRWLDHSPMKGATFPKTPKGRARRITPEEIDKVIVGCGGEGVGTRTQRVGMAFLFALETAARSGEIVGLHWRDVHKEARFVRFPETKNGDARDVPLSLRAVEILEQMPVTDGPVFGLNSSQRDALFRKVRKRTGIADLHFHDSRAEAIWRLSKKLDVLQLARVIGHRDINSLLIYYKESATDMAKLLD